MRGVIPLAAGCLPSWPKVRVGHTILVGLTDDGYILGDISQPEVQPWLLIQLTIWPHARVVGEGRIELIKTGTLSTSDVYISSEELIITDGYSWYEVQPCPAGSGPVRIVNTNWKYGPSKSLIEKAFRAHIEEMACVNGSVIS